jgi:hypothetical protein
LANVEPGNVEVTASVRPRCQVSRARELRAR